MELGGLVFCEQSGTSLRLTHLEAAALQSFPPDMVWPGNQGEKLTAIGNAVPPLTVAAILGALLAPRGERDASDNVFAAVADWPPTHPHRDRHQHSRPARCPPNITRPPEGENHHDEPEDRSVVATFCCAMPG
ncbi:DNA cytosine methyltransferase [Leucobacter manosquensis]